MTAERSNNEAHGYRYEVIDPDGSVSLRSNERADCERWAGCTLDKMSGAVVILDHLKGTSTTVEERRERTRSTTSISGGA